MDHLTRRASRAGDARLVAMLGVSDVEYYKGVILVFQIVADLRPVLVIQGPETPGISGVHSGAEHRDEEHGGGLHGTMDGFLYQL